MREGEYTFYTIQSRWVALSPHNKPNEPLEPIKDKDWSDGMNKFLAEPWTSPKVGHPKPKYRKSYDQTSEVWQKTGWYAWWDLKYAIKGMKRLQAASESGKMDHYDGYSVHTRAVRFEFRIVRITLSKKTEVMDINHVVEALC